MIPELWQTTQQRVFRHFLFNKLTDSNGATLRNIRNSLSIEGQELLARFQKDD
ncbi:MAG: hypothetical protein ACRD4X_15125 [Candidatus Acidiferrales bacterium]